MTITKEIYFLSVFYQKPLKKIAALKNTTTNNNNCDDIKVAVLL